MWPAGVGGSNSPTLLTENDRWARPKPPTPQHHTYPNQFSFSSSLLLSARRDPNPIHHSLLPLPPSLLFFGDKKMSSSSKVFTLEEVAKHSSKDDCWLVIGGKVYNVTKFLDDHPGGDDVLLSSTAKDATDDFEDVGHSTTARAMMDEYYVGEIDATTIPTKVKYTPPKQPHYNQDKTPEFVIKILQFLVPLAILGLAVAVRIYTKSESA
ncbi:hypothetical protein QYE76_059089 [Lolium multiflorum]|uniref:Cytochrome b5 heme-binding domain-containing protein n=2 Tax=Lolium TaxID=4520 RepID=A0AAD8WT10_LOLMU|nr:hypothetical protein QYE76_059089 [Lolium multiflorum]